MYSIIDKFGPIVSSSSREIKKLNIKTLVRNALIENFDENNDLNMRMRRIKNLKEPTDEFDAITRQFYMKNLNQVKETFNQELANIYKKLHDQIEANKSLNLQIETFITTTPEIVQRELALIHSKLDEYIEASVKRGLRIKTLRVENLTAIRRLVGYDIALKDNTKKLREVVQRIN